MQANSNTTTLRGIRPLLLWTAACALLLHVLEQLLTVRTGYGVEDYLGWLNQDAVDAMHQEWKDHGVDFLAVAYLVIDTVAYMPLYGALFFALADKFLFAVAQDAALGRCDNVTVSSARKNWRASLFAGALTFLLMVDLAENISGLVRLSTQLGWISWAGILLSGCGLLGVRVGVKRYFGNWWTEFAVFIRDLEKKWIFWGLLASSVLSIAWITLKNQEYLWLNSLVSGAHHVKSSLFPLGDSHFGILTIYLVLLAGLIAAWFFGFCFNAKIAQAEKGTKKPVTKAYERRSKFRQAFGDIFARSRYVIFALIVFTGLALAMNQGRDVIYSVADQPAAWQSWVIFIFSAIGMWSFGFACWLWTRSVCLIKSPNSPNIRTCTTLEDRFAKDWARFFGLLPALLFVLLCAATMRDALWAHKTESVWFMVLFTLFALAGGFFFIWLHVRDEGGKFYNCKTFDEWHASAKTGADSKKTDNNSDGRKLKEKFANAITAKYKLFLVITPFGLPFYAIAAMFICRLIPGGGMWPPTAIAIFLFSLTFWLSIFGWISLNEERIAIPWVGLLVLLVGLFGYSGFTQNHLVGRIVNTSPDFREIFSVLIAALLLILFSVFVAFNSKNEDKQNKGSNPPQNIFARIRTWAAHVCIGSERNKSGLSFLKGFGFAVLFIFGCIVILCLADKAISPAEVQRTAQADTVQQHELGKALSAWLTHIEREKSRLTDQASGKLYVNFVNAEGGGIRAAYWTAIVLEELQNKNTTFLERTFSYSGVSGGSVGMAVDRACKNDPKCVTDFGSADLLSPLLAAWMFEDVVAQLIPSSGCITPGCGFMSRGVAFERAMLRAVPKLSEELVKKLSTDNTGTHEPYLFLNSTWVESGERSIASDIEITPEFFPASRNQFERLKKNLTLATAAHNSARFPFVNAIGVVKGKDKESSGHLADGGYFDNSGGHTTSDLLRALGRCLTAGDAMPGCSDKELTPEVKQWLREHLLPQVIMIRNGVQIPPANKAPFSKPQPTGGDIRFKVSRVPYKPQEPGKQGEMKLYVDFLGPLVTAINTTGIGANGKVAEANLGLEVKALRESWRSSTNETPPVRNFDQIEDKTQLYPLGWHLSKGATEGMCWQIKKLCPKGCSSEVGEPPIVKAPIGADGASSTLQVNPESSCDKLLAAGKSRQDAKPIAESHPR